MATCASCGTTLARGQASPKSTSNPPLLRLAVSVAVPAAVLLVGRIALGDATLPNAYGIPTARPSMSVVALCIAPLLHAFLLIEVVALLVPALRRRRLGGPAGRKLLRRLSVFLAMLLASVQAIGVGTFLDPRLPAADHSWGSRLLTTLTLVAATAALFALTQAIDRWGLGNGFSVLILASTVPELWRVGLGLWRSVGAGVVQPASAQVVVVVLGSFVAATLMVLVPRTRQGRGKPLGPEKLEPFTIRLPACGAGPLTAAAAILGLPAVLAAFLPVLGRFAYDPTPGALGHTTMDILLGCAVALLLAWLFNRPARVTTVWRRVREESPANDLAAAKLRPAMLKSTVFVLVMVVGNALLATTVPGIDLPSTLVLVTDTAIILDLVREWRSRAKQPDLVPVWPVHRVYAVDAACYTLQRAGIGAFARGVHHRTMLQLFGPYVAVDLLVPEDRAGKARELLEDLLLPE